MSRFLAIALALISTGCSKVDLATEMEASLRSTNHAIGLALIVSDIASYHIDAPTEIPTGTTDTRRHGEIGPCPELFTLTDDLIEVDFGNGCLPRSGLMPVVVAGVALVERDEDSFDGVFDTYAINLSHMITGSVTATVTGFAGDLQIEAEFDLSATDGEASLDASGIVTATLTDTEVIFDAKITIDEKVKLKYTLKDVTLPFSDIPGECPEPTSGTATAHRDDDVVVRYSNPGGGQVTVQLGNRTSDDVRLCAFDSWIF